MRHRRGLATGILSLLAAQLSLGAKALPGHPRVTASAPSEVHLTILGTCDIHGHIYPTTYLKGPAPEAVGLARIETLVRRERARHKHVLLIDSGDLLQGSPLAAWFARHGDPRHRISPMIAAMNQMGYASFTVGNHDFDYGLPMLYKARRDARFPFISANVFKHGTRTLAFKPYVMVREAGLKIGIVGTTPPGVALSDKAQVAGRLDFGDAVKAFERYVPQLKAAGADLIIGAPHAGYGGNTAFGPTYDGYSADSGLPAEQIGYQLARQIRGLDVLLLGHSHQDVWSKPASDSTLVLGRIAGHLVQDVVPRPIAIAQADKWGEYLAKVDLTLQKRAGHWVIVQRAATTLSTRGVPPDPAILAVARKANQATWAYVRKGIATTDAAWHGRLARIEDTPIVDLVNAVQLASTHAQLSAAADFDTSVHLTRGPITMSEVAGIYPYENLLVAVRITGQQLKDYLEWTARYFAPYQPGAPIVNPAIPGFDYDMVAGVHYVIDLTRPVGSRIVDLSYRGKPVTPGQAFTLAINDYRQRGGGGFGEFAHDPVVYDRGEDIQGLIVSYLRHKKTLSPAAVFQHDNWRLAPAGAIDPATMRYRALATTSSPRP